MCRELIEGFFFLIEPVKGWNELTSFTQFKLDNGVLAKDTTLDTLTHDTSRYSAIHTESSNSPLSSKTNILITHDHRRTGTQGFDTCFVSISTCPVFFSFVHVIPNSLDSPLRFLFFFPFFQIASIPFTNNGLENDFLYVF